MATQRKIGAIIQLDGEKQFRSAVTQATSALKTMKSEMKLVDAQFAGQANTLTALTAKHEVLSKQLAQSQKIETETAEALANAQKNYEKAGSALGVYRENLAKAEQELEALRKAGTASDETIQEQERIVSDLSRAVTAGEKAYSQAGQNIESWSQKLNTAKIDTINLSREIEENDRLMKEASNSTDGIAHSIDGYGKAVKQVASETSEAVEDMTQHMDTFFTVDKIQYYADAVSSAFKSIATSAYDSAKEVDKGYDAIIQKSGATGEELTEMKDIADNLYTDMPIDMDKIGNAIGEVSTRFHLQGEELEKVSETALKFAELNKADVVDSIDSAQNMMAAFGQSISDVDKAYDVMNATGQKTGVNLSTIASKVTENAAAFQELGMDVYQSIDFMGQLETSGADASTVLSGMKRALKSATEEGKSFDEALADMEDKILNGTDSMDGLNAAYDLFGKSGAGIYTAVKTGSLSFKDLADSQKLVADSAGSVADTYESTLDAWDEITTAQHAFQESGAQLAGEVLSELAPAITALSGGIKDLTKWYKDLPGPAKKAVAGITALGVGAGIAVPKLLSLYKTFQAIQIAGGLKALPSQLADVSKGLKGLSDAGKTASAIGEVAEAVDDLTDVAKGASAVGEVAEAVDDVADATKGATGIAGVAGDIGELATAGTTATSVMSGLGSAVSVALPVIGGIAAVALAGYTALKTLSDKALEADESFQKFVKDMDEAEEKIESSTNNLNAQFDSAKESLDEVFFKHTSADSLVDELDTLHGKSHLTDDELARMQSLVGQLNALFPEMGLSVDKATGQIKAHGKVVNDIRSIYDNTLKSAAESSYYNAMADEFMALEEAKKAKKDASDELEKKQNELEQWEKDHKWVEDEFGNREQTLFGSLVTYAQGETAEHKRMVQEIEELTDAEKDHNKTVEEKQALYDDLKENGLDGYLESMGIATEKTEENADAVQRSESAYEKLARKIRDAGGALSDEDFAEDEADLQELYQRTVTAWQSYHDEFTAGLSDEMKSLGESMHKWQDYHDAVSDTLKSNSEMFNAVNHNEDVTWESMTKNLDDNVEAYSTWNKNVSEILHSARYQNDEEFRQMANSIMSMGIQGADYLQQFVDNIDNNVDIGLGDLARFGELGGVQEQYATTMANLQTATENGMDGIAMAYDETATSAELSLQQLSQSLQQQADNYRNWYSNVEELTNSERYQTDEQFREFANNVLSYGTAGADMLDSVIEAMRTGSTELDDVVADYMSLKGADEKAAQADASIKATLQDGFNSQVALVDDSQSQLATAFGNYADAGIEGFKNRYDYLGDVVNGGLTEAEKAMQENTGLTESAQTMADGMADSVSNGVLTMLDTARGYLTSFVNEAFNLGLDVGDSFASGMASSLNNSNASVSAGGARKSNSGDNVNNITMNVNGTEGQDPRTLADIVIDKLGSAIRQGVQAYGY